MKITKTSAKNIAPIQAALGKPQATKLLVTSIRDDLGSLAEFHWELVAPVTDKADEVNFVEVLTGNVTMSGADYADWAGDNQTAYAFIAKAIGVTLV